MKLAYEVDHLAGVQNRELPFVIGVLADFVGQPMEPLPRLRYRKVIGITASNFDAVLESLRPHVAFSVGNRLTEELEASELKVHLDFTCIDDFQPEAVARQVRPLRELLDLRRDMKELSIRLTWDTRLEAAVHRCLTDPAVLQVARNELLGRESDVPVLSRILANFGWSETNWSAWASEDVLICLASLIIYAADAPLPFSRDSSAIIDAAISQIERLVSGQLDVILQHPSFKKLEATWRGLAFLSNHTRDLPQVKVKLLNVSQSELLKDLQRASEFDDSALFKHLYSEFGVLGGEPFNILVGDYQFSSDPVDVELLEKISTVVGAAHCLFLSSVAPGMLQLSSFLDIEIPRSFARVFESTQYSKWAGFRSSDDSRYVGLVMPRVLLRGPHEIAPAGISSSSFFAYRQKVETPSDLLWGNAAFALAANLVDRFGRTERTLDCGESAGLLSGLPTWNTVSDQGAPVSACATEIAITDQRQADLSELGFIALCQRKGTADAVFFDLPSCRSPQMSGGSEDLKIQLRLSIQLENVLVTSRFAHYLKCILRDKFRTLSTLSAWEAYLNLWIEGYIAQDFESDADCKRPLLAGNIRIEPGHLGYEPRIIATLSPRFRNRGEKVALRVVVGLPQMKEMRA